MFNFISNLTLTRSCQQSNSPIAVWQSNLTVQCMSSVTRPGLTSSLRMWQPLYLMYQWSYCRRVDLLHSCSRVVARYLYIITFSTPLSLHADLHSLLSHHILTRSLRSSNTNLLSVPRVHTTFASRGFSVAVPSVWNSLPSDIRACSSSHTWHIPSSSSGTSVLLVAHTSGSDSLADRVHFKGFYLLTYLLIYIVNITLSICEYYDTVMQRIIFSMTLPVGGWMM